MAAMLKESASDAATAAMLTVLANRRGK